jgi:hypothetical protein
MRDVGWIGNDRYRRFTKRVERQRSVKRVQCRPRVAATAAKAVQRMPASTLEVPSGSCRSLSAYRPVVIRRCALTPAIASDGVGTPGSHTAKGATEWRL